MAGTFSSLSPQFKHAVSTEIKVNKLKTDTTLYSLLQDALEIHYYYVYLFALFLLISVNGKV